jgi:hypothetical protein
MKLFVSATFLVFINHVCRALVGTYSLNTSSLRGFPNERLGGRNDSNATIKSSDSKIRANNISIRSLATSLGLPGHTAHNRHVNKPWSSLPSVDGLQNDEVAMFVTSTAFKESYFLRARCKFYFSFEFMLRL